MAKKHKHEEHENHERWVISYADLVTLLFALSRGLGGRVLGLLAAGFAVAAVFANLHPFPIDGATTVLVAAHLPLALWLAVGIAQTGPAWGTVPGRMAFAWFSAELLIHFALIALGGAVLTACSAIIFKAIGVNIGPFIGYWLIPCGAAGALVVAGWLADARRAAEGSLAVTLCRRSKTIVPIPLLYPNSAVIVIKAAVFPGKGPGVVS